MEIALAPETIDSRRRDMTRLVAAIAVGVLAAVWIRSHALTDPKFTSDFDQVWAAARAWINGRNPYAEIGPNAPFKWSWPFYYPFPALLLVSPLGALPVLYARMIFGGCSAALFTWAISRDSWGRWPMLLSITFLVSVDLVQWSLLITTMFFFPRIGGLVAAKPNFGLPLLASLSRPRDALWIAAGGAALVAVSLAIRPTWPAEWLDNVRSAPHFRAPVARSFGFVLLLAALRWRRPEARWLLGLSLVPQAPSFYDPILLVVICGVWWEAAILCAGTWMLFAWVGAHAPQGDYAGWGSVVGNATTWFCYLPCLLMLLRRPNTSPERGPVPGMAASSVLA